MVILFIFFKFFLQLPQGFPNIWTWGLEDNISLKRIKNFNMVINYYNFINTENESNKIKFKKITIKK